MSSSHSTVSAEISITELDEILVAQLVVARLGERELMNWWNTDIPHRHGGADFLGRLVGKHMAILAAGEGILIAAMGIESRLLSAIPGRPAYSLFAPELGVRSALERRLRAFKSYPDEVPQKILALIEPEREWTVGDLVAMVAGKVGADSAEFEGTRFGRELSFDETVSSVRRAYRLAAVATKSEKNAYILPYYRIPDHG